MDKKIPVAILGATGTVGQKFIVLLENHPWFEVTELVASPNSAGKPYVEVCTWKQDIPIPDRMVRQTVLGAGEPLKSHILLSGIDSSSAGSIEKDYAEKGHIVISNASSHRTDKNVPLVIPEINTDHFEAIKFQNTPGAIITNPNCVVVPMAMTLTPLYRTYGIDWVQVTSMQSISGAGYPGPPAYDVLGNVIPFIKDEEYKVEIEPQKILGNVKDGIIESADFTVSAQCNRVAVVDGHTLTMSIKFKNASPSISDIKKLLKEWRSMPQEKKLPSAPPTPLVLFEEENRPQPVWDIHRDGCMAVCVGRIRQCSIGDIKLVCLGHNTVRGAAGAAVLNAEAFVELGYLKE